MERAVTHPGYDADTVDNDVALLRLPAEVRPDKYWGFACLPRYKQELPPAQQLCTIIGWGKRRSGDPFGTDVLHEATVGTNTRRAPGCQYESRCDEHASGNTSVEI